MHPPPKDTKSGGPLEKPTGFVKHLVAARPQSHDLRDQETP